MVAEAGLNATDTENEVATAGEVVLSLWWSSRHEKRTVWMKMRSNVTMMRTVRVTSKIR